MIAPETFSHLEEIKKRAGHLVEVSLTSSKSSMRSRPWRPRRAPTFWGSSERAQKHIAKLNGLKRAIAGVVAFHRKLDDAAVMVELIETATGAEKDQYGRELDQTVEVLVAELDNSSSPAFSAPVRPQQRDPFDPGGAGGTESCDWTDMLFRMLQPLGRAAWV